MWQRFRSHDLAEQLFPVERLRVVQAPARHAPPGRARAPPWRWPWDPEHLAWWSGHRRVQTVGLRGATALVGEQLRGDADVVAERGEGLLGERRLVRFPTRSDRARWLAWQPSLHVVRMPSVRHSEAFEGLLVHGLQQAEPDHLRREPRQRSGCRPRADQTPDHRRCTLARAENTARRPRRSRAARYRSRAVCPPPERPGSHMAATDLRRRDPAAARRARPCRPR